MVERSCEHGRLALPLILLLALLLRLPGLGESLWYDEAVYTSATMSGESRADVLFHDIHPPIYAWIVDGWTALFGENEVVLRLPSLVFGLGSIAATYFLAQRWLGSGAALLCGVLMAISPAHIWYSQENKNTILQVLMTSALMLFADRACRSRRLADWACLAILCLLAPWSHVHATWFVGAAVLWIWIQVLKPNGRPMWPGALAATIAAGIAVVPMVVLMLRNVGVLQYDYLKRFTLPEVYKLLLVYLPHGNTIRTISPYASLRILFEQHWGYLLVDAFVALLLLAGIVAAVRSVRPRGSEPPPIDSGGAEMLLLCLAVPLVGLLVASRFQEHAYIERSLLSLLPAFVILLVAGATRFRPATLRRPLVAALVVLGLAGVWNLHVAKADAWTVYKPNPDWRSAGRYLAAEREREAGGFPVFVSTPARALRCYLPAAVEHPKLPPPSPDPDEITIYYCASKRHAWVVPKVLGEGGFDRFYLIRNRVWGEGFSALRAAAEGMEGMTLVETKDFRNLSVCRYERADERVSPKR